MPDKHVREGAPHPRDQEGTLPHGPARCILPRDDPELVVLVERLHGYNVPETDEFVPATVALETMEGFEGDDARELVRTIGDAAPASEAQESSQGTPGTAT